METKKLRCINYVDCEEATKERVFNLEECPEKICPTCKKELEEFIEGNSKSLRKILILAIPLIIIIAGVGLFLSKENELEYDPVDGISVNLTPTEKEADSRFQPLQEEAENKKENLNIDNIEVEINAIGNRNNTTNSRLELIDDYLNNYTKDADVIILGKNSGNTLEIIPIKDYLERIAYFKTLKFIEVKEMLLDDKGLIWELRIIENHN